MSKRRKKKRQPWVWPGQLKAWLLKRKQWRVSHSISVLIVVLSVVAYRIPAMVRQVSTSPEVLMAWSELLYTIGVTGLFIMVGATLIMIVVGIFFMKPLQ